MEESFAELLAKLKAKAREITKQNKKFREAKTITTQYNEYNKLQNKLKVWETVAKKIRRIRRNFSLKR